MDLEWVKFMTYFTGVNESSELTKIKLQLTFDHKKHGGKRALVFQSDKDFRGDFSEGVTAALNTWRGAIMVKNDIEALGRLKEVFDEVSMVGLFNNAMRAAGLDLSTESSSTKSSGQKTQEAASTEHKVTKQGRSQNEGNGAEPTSLSSEALKPSTYFHKGKGRFFIINNEEFKNPEDRRTCATADQEAIKEFLEKLEIKKEDYDILKDEPINIPEECIQAKNGKFVSTADAEEIRPVKSEIKRVRNDLNDPKKEKYEYFCCFVMSHGSQKQYPSSARTDPTAKKNKSDTVAKEPGESVFVDKAGKEMTIEELISFFKADNCPGLKGKPKLFFIDACRGKQRGEAVKANDAGETGRDVDLPVETLKPKWISIESDMLIFYATPPGYLSYYTTGEKPRSVFIQNLCEVLNKNYDTSDIMEITTIVTEKVSEGSFDYKKSENCIQIPFATTTLRKQFFFKSAEELSPTDT